LIVNGTTGEKNVITIGDQSKRQKLPSRIERLFAAADVAIPAYGTVPIGKVDRALKGLEIEERLKIKATLRQLGIIE
jgi:hypothetical protein